MKTALTGFLIVLSGLLTAFAEVESSPVFSAGEAGYHTFRIPALIATPAGTLLAFCEGRKDNASDHGDIDLVLKRSEDGGKTWSALQVVHEEGGTEKITIGNPCPVIDRDTGTIWLPFNRDNDDVFMTHSTDDGKTWASPVEITATTKKENWDWYAAGPGHGIQIERGPHKGRLVIPCDHREKHEGSGDWKKRGRSHVIYSDDHGKTWQLGGVTGLGMNECEVVERADGSLLLSMRNYLGKNQRAFSLSTDGGESWSEPKHNSQVYCPTCQASIHRISLEKENLILYSGPGGPGRENLTIRASLNDGDTWPIWRELFHGKAAYSDLALLPDGEIGCLFEGGEKAYNEAIRFARFSKEWILKQEWTSPPKDSQAELGHGLTKEQISEGWIALFDGKTNFGWKSGTVKDGAIYGPTETKAQFQIGGIGLAPVVILDLKNASEALETPSEIPKNDSTQVGHPAGLAKNFKSKILRIIPHPEFKSIFNGENLDGWKILRHPNRPDDQQTIWTVEDGAIHAVNGPGAIEWQGDPIGNGVIQLEIKTGPLTNGGVFFRSIPGDFMNGYEAQIFNACYEHDPARPARYSSGSIDDRQMARRLVSRDGEWYTMTVIFNGPHIATWVNGIQLVDFTDTREEHENPRQGLRLKSGTIQIQARDTGTDLWVRNVRVGSFD